MARALMVILAAGVMLAAGVVSADDAENSWPQAISERPLTLDPGASDGHVTVGVFAQRFTNTTDGSMSTSTAEPLAIGGSVGVASGLDIGIDYQLTLSEFEPKGPFSVRARYRLVHDDVLDVAVAAAMTYDLVGENGDFFIGADVRYRPVEELAIGTSTSSILGPTIPTLSPMSGQLQIAFTRNTQATGESPPKPITFDLPVYGAFTPSPQLQVFLATNLGQINISSSANAFIFSKLIPVTAGIFYTPRRTMDFGLALWDDLQHVANAYDVLGFARFYKL